MGAGPFVTFALVDVTPYRLRYLVTTTGGAGGTVLPNAGGATPDLRTDALGGPRPILDVVSTPVADQAEARQVLMGEAPLPGLLHAHTEINGRGPPADIINWIIDSNEGAAAGDAPSAGFAVLIVLTPAGAAVGATAYLDVHVQHSKSH